jgi:hypothetical protein
MCLTSHVASYEAAFYFFFANLAQARALQVLVAGSRFLQIISAAFRIFFIRQVVAKQNVVFPNFP